MPTKQNKAKKSSGSKAKVSKVTPPVVDTAVVDEVVDTVVVDTVVVDTAVVDAVAGNNVLVAPQLLDYESEFRGLQDQLKGALALVKSAMSGLTALERKVSRDKKVVDKKMKVKVKRVKDPNAPPTGFQKPLNVSPELQKFLALPDGQMIARTEVTRAINAYCKKHSLQKEEDKRTINPDKVLTKLLRIGKGEELTFFNLQKYLKPHYPNKEGLFT